jgi:Arc/MetJ family transcription regulator
MRTTLNIDDAMLADAMRLTGLKEKTAVVHAGLQALIRRENARRLIALGGTDPKATAAPRRRPPHFRNS